MKRARVRTSDGNGREKEPTFKTPPLPGALPHTGKVVAVCTSDYARFVDYVRGQGATDKLRPIGSDGTLYVFARTRHSVMGRTIHAKVMLDPLPDVATLDEVDLRIARRRGVEETTWPAMRAEPPHLEHLLRCRGCGEIAALWSDGTVGVLSEENLPPGAAAAFSEHDSAACRRFWKVSTRDGSSVNWHHTCPGPHAIGVKETIGDCDVGDDLEAIIAAGFRSFV